MEAAINHQRKIWHRPPNVLHGRKREYSIFGSLKNHALQNAKGISSSFIVDWQLDDSNSNAVQLSLFF